MILKNFTTLKASFGFDPDQMDRAHSEMGKYAAVAPIFAVMALLLAAVGLYAVIAHSVSQRTKEIGVRMAIGAAAEDIRRMVLRDGMLPVAIGMILGLGGIARRESHFAIAVGRGVAVRSRYDGRRARRPDLSRAARLPDSRAAGHERRPGRRLAA